MCIRETEDSFQTLYMCTPAQVAPTCPRCECGKLTETSLGVRCIGDTHHGVESCGYKSWVKEVE